MTIQENRISKLKSFFEYFKRNNIKCQCFIREGLIVFRVHLLMDNELSFDENNNVVVNDRLDLISKYMELYRHMCLMSELYSS